MGTYPPLGFYFEVKFLGIKKLSFKEVSGIGFEIEQEIIKVGGENGHNYKAPKSVKYNDLVLKRGVVSKNTDFFKMLNSIPEIHLLSPVIPSIQVNLLNEKGNPLTSWIFFMLSIKSWSISDLDATKNEVLLESITLSYNKFKRL